MSGKIIIVLAVACISMVSAVQDDNVGGIMGRFKRQSLPLPPAHWKELANCCKGVPNIIKQESRSGCFPAMNNSQPRVPGNWSCWVECAYRAQKLIPTNTDSLDNTAIAARVAQLVAAHPSWSSLITSAYTTCKAPPQTIPAHHVCKSGAASINHCMNKYLFSHCPSGVKNPSADCTSRLANIK